MIRLFRAALAFAVAGCAAAPPAPVPAPSARTAIDEAKARCERSTETTRECVDLLTRPQIESRRQVEAAEAAREADAFQGRLADLRAAVERRQGPRRTSTTTAAVAKLLGRRPGQAARAPFGPTLEEPDFGPEAETPEAPALEDARPTSANADRPTGPVAASARPPPGAPSPPEPPRSSLARPASGWGEPRAAAPLNPTPELYLRGGRCLLSADHQIGLAALKGYRRSEVADRDQAGRWALTLTDVTALSARIAAELTHRKLAKGGPVCMSSEVRPVVALLRSLVGPAPSDLGRARMYGRGLSRLDRELQVRAGLPRSE